MIKILGCGDPRYKHENQMKPKMSWKAMKCQKISGKVMKSHEKFMKSHYMKLHEVTWEKCKKSKKLLEKCKSPNLRKVWKDNE